MVGINQNSIPNPDEALQDLLLQEQVVSSAVDIHILVPRTKPMLSKSQLL